MWVVNPTNDVIIKTNCEVGAAKYIVNPTITIIKGTNMTPPPIPNKLEIIPATNVPEKKESLPKLIPMTRNFH